MMLPKRIGRAWSGSSRSLGGGDVGVVLGEGGVWDEGIASCGWGRWRCGCGVGKNDERVGMGRRSLHWIETEICCQVSKGRCSRC